MNAHRFSCILGVLALCAAGCAAEVDEDVGGLAGPLTATEDEWLPAIGVHTGVTLAGPQLDTLQDNHVSTVRLLFVFRPDVTIQADGTIRPEQFDWQVAQHARRGIHVLPILHKTVTIIRDGEEVGVSRYVERGELDAWERFAASLAARFGPGGAFWNEYPELPYLPIRAWEIWNEPNLHEFWDGVDGQRPKPRHYRRILRRAFIGLRTVDPRARVVLGGIAFPSDHEENMAWRDFMDRLFDGKNSAQRTRNRCLVDAVAIHPYAGTVGGSFDRIRNVYDFLEDRNMTGRNREKRDVQIWITELGWAVPVEGQWPPAHGPADNTVDSEEKQAQRVNRVVDGLERRRGRLGLGPLYWYTYSDIDGVHGGEWPDFSGLWTRWQLDEGGAVVTPGRARPAWHVLGQRASTHPVLRLPPARCTLGEAVPQREASLARLASDEADDAAADEPESTSCPATTCMDATGREICAGDRGVLMCADGSQVCTCNPDGSFSACTSCVST